MYSKKDFVEHFLTVDTASLSSAEVKDLFHLCIKNDSFRVALQLYLNNMRASITDGGTLDVLSQSLHDSVQFHEYKLFFILTHFD